MDLLLWRHAEAEDPGPGDDLERALTARGRAQAERVAAWLAERLPDDARVLVSPAKRCRQTVALLGRKTATVAALGPGATAEALLAAAGWPNGDDDTVVVVGHQPTLGEAAALAMGAGAADWQVKKGAVWWLKRSKSGTVRIHAVQSPDEL